MVTFLFPIDIVAHKYKYRQFNEEVDTNVQHQVDVFIRNFDRKDASKEVLQQEWELTHGTQKHVCIHFFV